MIFVDDLQTYSLINVKPQARRYGQTWCHMFTDGEVDELHAFAQRLGLPRVFFQMSKGAFGDFPHYDLTPSKRELALRLGAEEVSLREYIKAKMEAQE